MRAAIDFPPVKLRTMRPTDISPVLRMLRDCEGVGLRSADSPAALKAFLRRNPRLSVVAVHDQRIVGCAFVGHDGRRGYLHHVAVDPDFRRAGVGRSIVTLAFERLQRIGIAKVHCDVFRTNRAAQRFWKSGGWSKRTDIVRFSIVLGDDPNA